MIILATDQRLRSTLLMHAHSKSCQRLTTDASSILIWCKREKLAVSLEDVICAATPHFPAD